MTAAYTEALQWIHSRLAFGIRPGLKRMQAMMEALGHPERDLPIIHIGGTNGKGSTVSYLLHIFNEAGYTAGTFTSPYLESFNERISVNGIPVSDEEMVQLVQAVKPAAEALEDTELGSPTEFEVITAMAFYYFGRIYRPDVLLLEVGLGGKYDSTNIIQPLLSIITSVGHDHINILGSSIEEIAGEKAGIIKWKTPILSGAEIQEASAVIEAKAFEEKSDLLRLNQEIILSEIQAIGSGEQFNIKTPALHLEEASISMTGIHQVKNAALAIAACGWLNENGLFHLEEEKIRKGLQKTRWNGRLETISENPAILLDGAHNREGVQSLVSALSRHYSDRKIYLVFAALKDKEYGGMITELERAADRFYLSSFDFPRAASAEELFQKSSHTDKEILPDWETGIEKIAGEMTPDGLLVITGSLYFISQVRSHLLK
ncbi:bifunctional folylpolyglutamate synthase/dihydrofolate synthase [Metabacillus sp. GX 13764]|uniref:bifunctional folylpolyglutamate synthase/dihydrofolate synthase n=1 Tax=Metabacillus kandeliae TaxID=2900151 RepID=UPI001E5DB259|nr:folylpolyglutamate synthase/dihydrofolate synthase family protein [Metabacillus kandeliae]MCD7032899.1 bifunctional folylpolyglutamate synthase/dihydrofolate synthase [Metabacillus kandeliae]